MNLIIQKYKSSSVVAKATMWFMVCGILQKSISLLTTPIFTRLMTTEQYGQFTIYHSWINLFSIITTFRLDYAVFNKGMSRFPDERDQYTSSMQGATNCITLAVFVVYWLFRDYINLITELSTGITCFMFLELFFLPAIRFWTLRQRYEYRYKAVVGVTLLLAVTNALAGVVAVLLMEDKGVARIYSVVFVESLFGFILYTVNLFRGKQIFNTKFVKFAVAFNLPLLFYYFSGYVLNQADRIMIQKMSGYSSAAIYGIAYNVGLVLMFVITSINAALAPWEYDCLEKKKYQDIEKKFHPIAIGVMLLLTLFIAFAPEAVLVLAGRKYSEATYIIPAVTASVLFQMVSAMFANVEFHFNKNKFATYIAIFEAVINVVLNYWGIKMFGYIAAGYVTLLCYMLDTVLHHVYLKRYMKSNGYVEIYHDKNIVIYCLTMIAVSMVMTILYSHPVARYLIISVMGVLAYIKRKTIIEMYKSLAQMKKARKKK